VAHRSLIESMIYLTRRSDRTIFFSSHQLADVERVADTLPFSTGASLRGVLFAGDVSEQRAASAAAFSRRAAAGAEHTRPASGLSRRGRTPAHLWCITARQPNRRCSAVASPRWNGAHQPGGCVQSVIWASGARNHSFWRKHRRRTMKALIQKDCGEPKHGRLGLACPGADTGVECAKYSTY